MSLLRQFNRQGKAHDQITTRARSRHGEKTDKDQDMERKRTEIMTQNKHKRRDLNGGIAASRRERKLFAKENVWYDHWEQDNQLHLVAETFLTREASVVVT